jgi:hypothetical protein
MRGGLWIDVGLTQVQSTRRGTDATEIGVQYAGFSEENMYGKSLRTHNGGKGDRMSCDVVTESAFSSLTASRDRVCRWAEILHHSAHFSSRDLSPDEVATLEVEEDRDERDTKTEREMGEKERDMDAVLLNTNWMIFL